MRLRGLLSAGVLVLALSHQAVAGGGPDTFGYNWLDSDDTGGPVFNWVEISGTGTPVFTENGDDRNFGPFPIGFTFPFYGNDFTEFRVCSNGWVSFTSTSTDLSNAPLPGTGAPENLLAAFHDDLVVDLSIGGNVYYESDGTRLVIQYDNVRRYGSGGPYTFQILIYPDGSIRYQYLTMEGTRLDEATIGIQNATRDDGLTVVYNDTYVHDNLAIVFDAGRLCKSSRSDLCDPKTEATFTLVDQCWQAKCEGKVDTPIDFTIEADNCAGGRLTLSGNATVTSCLTVQTASDIADINSIKTECNGVDGVQKIQIKATEQYPANNELAVGCAEDVDCCGAAICNSGTCCVPEGARCSHDVECCDGVCLAGLCED